MRSPEPPPCSAGRRAWPAEDGEPVFAEPWEGRAFAMALDVVERAGLPWEDFRTPARRGDRGGPAAAVLRVLGRRARAAGARRRRPSRAADLDRARNRAAAYRYDEPGLGDVEVFPVRPDEQILRAMLTATVRRARGGTRSASGR